MVLITASSPPVNYTRYHFAHPINQQLGCFALGEKQTKQYAEDRDRRDEQAAERQVVGRKFDQRDEEGNGTIEREQVNINTQTCTGDPCSWAQSDMTLTKRFALYTYRSNRAPRIQVRAD